MSTGAQLSAAVISRPAKALKRSERAVRKAESDRRVAVLREQADEAIAPAIQRTGIEGVKAPRLVRDGNTFRVASPIATLFKMGRKRSEAGDEPTVNIGHVRCVDRLQRSWELSRTITFGTSSYGTAVGGGGDPAVMSETVLNAVNQQHEASAEVMRVRFAVEPFWNIIESVALEGQDIKLWAEKNRRDKQAAYGYLTGALDLLVSHYRRQDELRRRSHDGSVKRL